MTAGGPGEASQTTPLYIYQQALQLYDISYGTAMCLVLCSSVPCSRLST